MPSEVRPISCHEVTALMDHTEELLTELQLAADKHADRELRRKLLECVSTAHLHGVHLDLSEPGSRLGGEMFFANRRAERLGWL